MDPSRLSFIRQQGFPDSEANDRLFTALMLQPRIIGVLSGVGVLYQSGWLFLALSAVLWWGSIVPTQNVFDAIYNVAIARPRRFLPLGAAPPPRRFAMGMAAAIALVTAVAVLANAGIMAWTFEAIFVAGVLSVVVRNFCLGSHLYYVLKRQSIALRPGRHSTFP